MKSLNFSFEETHSNAQATSRHPIKATRLSHPEPFTQDQSRHKKSLCLPSQPPAPIPQERPRSKLPSFLYPSAPSHLKNRPPPPTGGPVRHVEIANLHVKNGSRDVKIANPHVKKAVRDVMITQLHVKNGVRDVKTASSHVKKAVRHVLIAPVHVSNPTRDVKKRKVPVTTSLRHASCA